MVGQSHSTIEIGQCRWREGDCIVKVLLRTHYAYSGSEEIMVTKLVRIAEISATSKHPIFTAVYHLINEDNWTLSVLWCYMEFSEDNNISAQSTTVSIQSHESERL